MKKILFLMFICLFAAINVMAQKAVSGTFVDKDTKDGVAQATVSLLKRDSSFVKGVISDIDGKFTVTAPSDGNYLLKVTSVGYKTLVKPVQVKGTNVSLGQIMLTLDAVMLKEAIVSGQAAKMTVKEDTFVYNAAAYHTPEGSVIEELVKRLPGAQVSDDGTITMNGKEVKKILVDGKEFMTGDTETALKNLPTSIIDKVKSYDRKSDLARVTGIDDGEEETVLDFGIKRGMNKGFMGNFDFAIGTDSRYAERGMVAYMKDNLKIMGFGSANNTGDKGFPGGGGGMRFGGVNNGLSARKMLGFNVNYQNAKILTIDGSVRWNHSDSDVWTSKSTESFLSTVQSFGNSRSQSFSRGDSWNAQMRLEWSPDTMTNIMFRPNVSISKSDNASSSADATFNADPYESVGDPLSDEGMEKLEQLGELVNSKKASSLSYSKTTKATGMFQFNRKLGNRGRNVTFRADVNYSDGDSKSTSLQDVTIFDYLAANGDNVNKNEYSINRYNLTPTKTYGYTLKGTYSEPLGKQMFLQATYSFKYSKSKSDRSTYDYSNITGYELVMPVYRDWETYLGRLNGYPDIEDYLDEELSKKSEYDTYTHEGALQLRKIGKKWNYTVGFMFQPQHTALKYKYQGVDTVVKRNVVNFAPSLDLRYKISKVSQLRATYRATTTQPSMTDLLDIRDDSDPLNISTGNPDLKPSFKHNFRLFYNGYAPSYSQSWMTHINFSVTQNSIASCVRYNEATGGRETKPENINGNWDLSGALMYNRSIDSAGVWNINTFTNINYQNHVSYLMQDNVTMKNTTRSTTIGERLSVSYRSSWLEVEPNGQLRFAHTRNLLQSQSNLDTWNFNYGMNVTVTAPWGTGFSTDAHMNSRRGYNDASLNTNEFVWNAQISQSFLKGKPLTLSVQFYDILKKQSSLSRAISATQRTDSEYNTINSYVMFHLIYKVNSFGGKAARSGGGGDGGRPDFNDRRFSRDGGRGGMPPRRMM
ncbi:MAG: outer membrane beta-barrel protein [Bacteroidales bacterium]|nr:outer membrane beta-barrel protein [Bacteroidales bacterium]MCM1146976.1 outer membrane beta-barrel protein [Bacteroidales bacterium]MCM1205891.1 outer membrane beta-barrel protein [Bacillota bacterium]MCM1509868.1 outer membrane beta-barrel protein [Clostridium sp.]